MDELDQLLITELVNNPRLSNLELADRLGTSEKTIRRRVTRLNDEGVIQWAVVPDPRKLGFEIRSYIALEVELGSIDKVVEYLSNSKNVSFLAVCTGRVDILVEAWFKSSDEMLNFVKYQLGQIPGIRRSETSVSLAVNRLNFGKKPFIY